MEQKANRIKEKIRMDSIKVRNLIFGQGKPKICVPITGRTKEEILQRTEELKAAAPDLAEWRADWYEDVKQEECLKDILQTLRGRLGNMPLLVTFRTKGEGGEQEIASADYEKFLERVLALEIADMLDAELFMGEELFKRICKKAHKAGVRVVGSSHDFEKTPSRQEIIDRLCRMQELGADFLKLAAMPRDAGDVLTLLEATWEMKKTYARQPVITMSMGGTGVISRLSGEIFGSVLTFGSAGQASAPGQVEAEKLKNILELLHKSL